MTVLEEAMDIGQKVQREKAMGQESLFGVNEIVSHNGNGYGELPAMDEWPEKVLLGFEKESLGFYITGHPLARHEDTIRRFATCDTSGLQERPDKSEVRVCGIVAGLKELTTKKGDRMAFVTLEDLGGFVEMVVFPETYAASMDLLKSEEPLLVSGTLDVGEDTCKLMANEVVSLREVKERQTKKVHFRVSSPGLEENQLRALRGIMERHRGECEPLVHLVIPNRSETTIRPVERLKVAASDQLMEEAEKLFGYKVVTFE
jgi:DNA polymerase-3 subunit alpha